MSFENVKKYFAGVGLADRVVERQEIGATVEQAAQAIGCEPERIAKAMSFLIGEEPILIVAAGDAKINSSKYKAQFQQKAVMLPGDRVAECIGHIPGAVCPFAIKEGVRVYLDVSLRRFDILYTAGGSINSTVKLSLDELVANSGSFGWVDVCNGWLVNDNP